jgi:hypothetical protein
LHIANTQRRNFPSVSNFHSIFLGGIMVSEEFL